MKGKIDTLSDQLAELSLLVKNQSANSTREGAMGDSVQGYRENDHFCSYCQKPVHGANWFAQNPNQNKKCSIGGKTVYDETTCWSTSKPNDSRAVSFIKGTSALDEEDTEDTHEEHLSSENVSIIVVKICLITMQCLRLKGGQMKNQSRRILERKTQPLCNES